MGVAGRPPLAMEAPRAAWHSRGGGLFAGVFGGSGHCSRSEGHGLSESRPLGALTRLNSLQVPVSPGAFGALCIGALENWKQLSSTEEREAQADGLAFFASRGLRWHVSSLEAAVPSSRLLQALATASPRCADAVVSSGGPMVMLDAAKVHSNCLHEDRRARFPALT